MTIAEYINAISKSLEQLYDKNEARAIAQIYISNMLNMNNTQLIVGKFDKISHEKLKNFQSDLERLKNSEPVQYVVGKASFYGLEFLVDRKVLIPRQETELLVKYVCDCKISSPKILDIGCGSGCIAISVQKNRPDAKVFAIDISDNALNITRKNAIINKSDIQTARYDILSEDTFPFDTKFDIIVSNPPYVRHCEKAMMHKNVTAFEPELALYVNDDDPLIFYRRILEFANKHQNEQATKIYFEINEYLSRETVNLCKSFGYRNVSIINDLENKNRFIEAVKN